MDTSRLVCVLCLLPSSLTFFLGPVAVGAGLGAIFASRGERLGVVLARSRLHRRTAKRTYSYSSDNHYRNNLFQVLPDQYFYCSKEGFPDAENQVDERAIARRPEREIHWYEGVVKMDQDDCTKRLFCELTAKMGSHFTLLEQELMDGFKINGTTNLNVSEPTAVYQLASRTGRVAGAGVCGEVYGRCRIPVTDILHMIEKELKQLVFILQMIQDGQLSVEVFKELEKINYREVETQIEKDLEALQKVLHNVEVGQVWG